MSKFDSERAEEAMVKLREQLEEVEGNLDNLTRYAVNYYKASEKYGASWGRSAEIATFNQVATKT